MAWLGFVTLLTIYWCFFCGGNNGQNRLVPFDGMAAADSRADNQLSQGDAGQWADGADLLCAVSGLPQWGWQSCAAGM